MSAIRPGFFAGLRGSIPKMVRRDALPTREATCLAHSESRPAVPACFPDLGVSPQDGKARRLTYFRGERPYLHRRRDALLSAKVGQPSRLALRTWVSAP